MKRGMVGVLLGSLIATLAFIPIANAEVVTPKWTDGDRFEYMGYDTFAIRNFENFVFNGAKTDFCRQNRWRTIDNCVWK